VLAAVELALVRRGALRESGRGVQAALQVLTAG